MHRSIVQFAVRSDSPGGGSLKLRHYFEHVLASEFGARAEAYLPDDTRWNGANPWTVHRRRVTHSVDWSRVAVMVISGRGWDRFIPERFHGAPPFHVVYLVQSFERIDPSDSQFRHLAHPAIRICVSAPLEKALRALEVANGPIYTFPAGVDLAELQAREARDIDILILGLKRPDMARSLKTLAERAGLRATLLMKQLAREVFIEALSRARIVVCLPASREGFYLPALEAMALGALTICPDAGGNDYCVDRVNCFKPAYRLNALMNGLKEAAGKPDWRAKAMSDNARVTASRHDLRHERAKFQRLLREIMKARGPGA